MTSSTQRLNSLRASVDWRYESLWFQEMDDIIYGWKEKYPWMKTMENVKMMLRSRNDEKRIHLPMPESDRVLGFLDTISAQVSELVSQRDEEVNWDLTFFDNGESPAFQTEIKAMFINTLRWFIQNRKIPENYNFEDSLVSLKNFDIASLYDFLHEVSWRSEEEIREFILDEIPSLPWDGIESTFWQSQK